MYLCSNILKFSRLFLKVTKLTRMHVYLLKRILLQSKICIYAAICIQLNLELVPVQLMKTFWLCFKVHGKIAKQFHSCSHFIRNFCRITLTPKFFSTVECSTAFILPHIFIWDSRVKREEGRSVCKFLGPQHPLVFLQHHC